MKISTTSTQNVIAPVCRKEAMRETKVRAAETNAARDEERTGPWKGKEKQTSQDRGDLVSSGIANGDIEMASDQLDANEINTHPAIENPRLEALVSMIQEAKMVDEQN